MPLQLRSTVYRLFIKTPSPCGGHPVQCGTFLRLSELSTRLSETAKVDYCEPVSSTAFLDYAIRKVGTHDAAPPAFIIHLVQLVVPGSNSGLYQASAVRVLLKQKSNGGIFRGVVAAVVRPDEQRGQSALPRMLRSLVEVQNTVCQLGPPISAFLTDTGSVRARGLVVVDSFRTSVAKQLEQLT